MTRPRVSARHEIAPVSDQRTFEIHAAVSPYVIVDVQFDLHDHDAALAELERAVAIVKAQIEETHRD